MKKTMPMGRPLRYISLCSGIEAASVAWGSLGWTPVCFSEIEEFPSEVLRHRFPCVPNVGDVTTYDWGEYHGAADVVAFGSPCTSFSIAGLRKGLDDPRGMVMLKCLEAAKAIEPRWVLIENVPALLSSHGGKDFQTLLETMARFWSGGSIAWRVLRSEFYGLAQKRQRLFVVISTGTPDGAAKVLLDEEGDRRPSQTSEERWQELANRAGISTHDEGWCLASAQAHAELVTGGLSPTLTTLHEAPIWIHPDGEGWTIRRLTPDEYEVLMGLERGWTRIPWNGRPPERCPDNKRYRAVGNSFPVPILRWIGERIQEVDALLSS